MGHVRGTAAGGRRGRGERAGQRRAARLVRRLPARDGLLDPAAVDALLLRGWATGDVLATALAAGAIGAALAVEPWAERRW